MDNIRREKRIEHHDREREREIEIKTVIGDGKAGSLSGNFLKRDCFGGKKGQGKEKVLSLCQFHACVM